MHAAVTRIFRAETAKDERDKTDAKDFPTETLRFGRLCPYRPIRPHHPITLSPSHPLTLSPSPPLTLSPSHPLTLSPSHPLTVSPSHRLTVTVAMSRNTLLSLPFIALIWAYRLTLSPFLGRHCRFEPTCSAYGADAVARHGVLRGGLLTARRLLRCRPGGGCGVDPVP